MKFSFDEKRHLLELGALNAPMDQVLTIQWM